MKVNDGKLVLQPGDTNYLVCTPTIFREASIMQRRALVLEQIESVQDVCYSDGEPFGWDQGTWVEANRWGVDPYATDEAKEAADCWTSFCTAGWSLMLAGEYANMILHGDDAKLDWIGRSYFTEPAVGVHSIHTRARQLLGLDGEDAKRVFLMGNDFETLSDRLLNAAISEGADGQ